MKEVDQRVRDIGREIRQIEDSSSKDYGLNEEFQALDGKCFDYTDREYTYKLCPFDYGSQRPRQGGSETRLGSWGSWDGPVQDKYSKMHYDKGVQCWNGPQRSLQVRYLPIICINPIYFPIIQSTYGLVIGNNSIVFQIFIFNICINSYTIYSNIFNNFKYYECLGLFVLRNGE